MTFQFKPAISSYTGQDIELQEMDQGVLSNAAIVLGRVLDIHTLPERTILHAALHGPVDRCPNVLEAVDGITPRLALIKNILLVELDSNRLQRNARDGDGC